jgi:hypothetical protein
VRPGRPFSPRELAKRDDSFEESDQLPAATAPAALPSATITATTTASGSPVPGRLAPQGLEQPAARQVQLVSLGTGIALIGLGLGFLGLRLRRTN